MNTAKRLGLWRTVIALAIVMALTVSGLAPRVLAQSQSNDATLSALTLSDVDFGTFAPGTTSYSATVASTVIETTVTPTTNHSEASYAIKLAGVEDEDGVIQLAASANVITVEVTAEDGRTTQTYSVTVTRPASTYATLSSLTLSDVDFGTFASDTTSYTASVANRVRKTTVTPTANHSGASHVIELDSVEDTDGVVSLSVGKQRHNHRGNRRRRKHHPDIHRDDNSRRELSSNGNSDRKRYGRSGRDADG